MSKMREREDETVGGCFYLAKVGSEIYHFHRKSDECPPAAKKKKKVHTHACARTHTHADYVAGSLQLTVSPSEGVSTFGPAEKEGIGVGKSVPRVSGLQYPHVSLRTLGPAT